MTKRTGCALLAFVGLLVTLPAHAQTTTLTLTPQTYPKWDAGGGWGLRWDNHGGEEFDNWEPANDVRFDLGRYWTQHLKSSLGVSYVRSDDYRDEFQPVAGLPNGAYSFTLLDHRTTRLSPNVTYQFFENAFAHPYVSAGLDVDLTRTHEFREARTTRFRDVSYTVMALDRHTSTVTAQPFAAAGFKSYFTNRVFLRTEGLASFGSHGIDRMTARIGVGVDF